MKIALSDKFTYKKLIKFTLPSILMMVFTSVYGVVDGFFVSNFVGKQAFTAVNLIMPFLLILGAVGFMFGSGGSALIAKTLGEGNRDKANKIFSLIVYTSTIIGIILALLGVIFLPFIAKLMGANGSILTDCVKYGRVIAFAVPLYMLQCEFQSFFATAEKPNLGFYVTLIAGCTNIVLDALFVALFKWGILGAAYATAISQAVGAIIPIVYFKLNKKGLIVLGRAKLYFKELLVTCTNGSSELLNNIAMSIVSMLYNKQLLKYAGQDGVASYGVLMYVGFVFVSIFIGYSVGVAPIIGYNFGAKNNLEMKNVRKKSLIIIIITSLAMFVCSEVLAYPVSKIFVGYDKELTLMTVNAFRYYSFSFVFSGLAIFGSAFFTALNNGVISAIIATFRTLILQVVCVLILPLLWGINGIWISLFVSEALATVVTMVFIKIFQNKYGY